MKSDYIECGWLFRTCRPAAGWQRPRPTRAAKCGWLSLVAALAIITLAGPGWAQEADDELGDEAEAAALQVAVELLERPPFDQVTLDAQNGSAVLDILPLESVPTNPKPTDRLRIHLVSDPEQAYDVLWQHIVKVRTYHQLVFEDAQRLVREKKYDEAFRNFDFLLRHTAVTPGLNQSVQDYLLENAAVLAEQQNYQHALAILEEIARRDPSYRAAEVATRLAQVVDKLLLAEVEREDYRKARGMIERLEKQYGSQRIESLGRWRQRLVDEATQLKQQSQLQIEQGAFREAERLIRRMIRIWPDLPGAEELRLEIARRYPMVIVGVAEKAGQQDVTSIESWPARRTGGLTQQTLLQFIGAGPQGGQYLCPLGDYYQSDDRRRLTVHLWQNAETGTATQQVTGYDVSARVLAMADPASPLYDPSWASLTQAVGVEDVFKVHIDLRRPHVLPEAMLQIQLDKKSDDPSLLSPGDGPYLLADSPDEDLHFVANQHYPFPGNENPAEIVERYFPTSEDAISALRRGDIDMIDYLFPDDAARLKNDEALNVESYALPTIHVLVPNYSNPFTANQTFRRALIYGIDRQTILNAEVLGNNKIAGCQLISGPFPPGTRDNDPLAYAYDSRITPQSYYPRLAAILRALAHRELREIAKKRNEEIPDEIRLVIGYPGNQIARVACQAIAQYLQVVGIVCELRELPAGMSTDPTGEVDLLYVQVAMWEPVIDARRLLAPQGVAALENEYVGMALRRLDAAKNWREARERLHELHRIVHEQVAVIPLWQTVNYLVHSRQIRGVGPLPLTLYQNVEQWQVTGKDSGT